MCVSVVSVVCVCLYVVSVVCVCLCVVSVVCACECVLFVCVRVCLCCLCTRLRARGQESLCGRKHIF